MQAMTIMTAAVCFLLLILVVIAIGYWIGKGITKAQQKGQELEANLNGVAGGTVFAQLFNSISLAFAGYMASKEMRRTHGHMEAMVEEKANDTKDTVSNLIDVMKKVVVQVDQATMQIGQLRGLILDIKGDNQSAIQRSEEKMLNALRSMTAEKKADPNGKVY